MSHWKALNNRALQDKPKPSKTQRSKTKFSPAKSQGDDEISVRFRNESLSRIHDSMMSSGIRDRSINKSLFKSHNDQNGLKNGLTSVQLKKSLTSQSVQGLGKLDRQMSSPHNQETILPASITGNHFGKESERTIEKVENKGMYQEQIDKIKKQFKEFQQAIFLQLRRQQKIITAMIDQILEQIQQKMIEPAVAVHIQQNDLMKQAASQEKDLNHKLQQLQEEKKSPMVRYDSLRQARKTDREMEGDGSSKEKLSFNRFFDAMNMLKREMKDISSLSNVASPRSSSNYQSWQAALEKLKKKH